jgi:large subunit ribosomal protein L29
MKKSSDIKSLTITELQEKIVNENEVLNRLKFGHAISPIENPMKMRETRKVIARLKTELRAKQLSK